MSYRDKKIAVIVRGRQAEALRMAIGLTIFNDVDIYIFDRKLILTDEVLPSLEMIREIGMGFYTNIRMNEGIEHITTENAAKKLMQYDNILPY